MASLLEAMDIKRKTFFEFEDAPYLCLDVEVSKPTARGGQTLVRLKMRNLLTRAVFDKTFKAGDKFKEPDLDVVPASYLYGDGDGHHFMDQGTLRDDHADERDARRRSPAARRQRAGADPQVQRPPDRRAAAAARGAGRRDHRARRARRYRQRRRHQAGHARDGSRDPRAALHQGRREGEGAHGDARVRRTARERPSRRRRTTFADPPAASGRPPSRSRRPVKPPPTITHSICSTSPCSFAC